MTTTKSKSAPKTKQPAPPTPVTWATIWRALAERQ